MSEVPSFMYDHTHLDTRPRRRDDTHTAIKKPHDSMVSNQNNYTLWQFLAPNCFKLLLKLMSTKKIEAIS